jgi:hypothetical protein
MTKHYVYVESWLFLEHKYTVDKFGLSADAEHIKEFNSAPDDNNWWENQINMYLHRARTLGLDTPGGRQALAKAASTAVMATRAAVEEFGQLPKAGVTSGEGLDDLVPLF